MEQFLEKFAKTVFELMIDGDKDPQKIVEGKGIKTTKRPKSFRGFDR